MRLSHPTKVKQIIQSKDPHAKVYLFGSRVDDNTKGGDIDLLVISSRLTAKDKPSILLKLYDLLGEQKIDLLITKQLDTPFEKHAYETGLEL